MWGKGESNQFVNEICHEETKSKNMTRLFFAIKSIAWLMLGFVISVGGMMLFFYSIGFSPPPPIIPQNSPDEEYRIHASGFSKQGNGFSMVVPKTWHSSAGEMIWSQSAKPSSSSYPLGMILVWETSLDEFSEEIKTAEKITFQGSAANLMTNKNPRDTGAGFQIVFQRSNKWYTAVYSTNRGVDKLPPVVMEYFETFRIDEKIEE
ncbi:MAG: hypothetical protein JXM70_12385 [Pirellulales bacterium]|nr:hypothetical protein [Pirellulales bacterium]